MRALVYFPSIPRYLLARALGKRFPVAALPLRLAEVPEPNPPEGFVSVRVRLAGVCGSDLALLYGKNSPRLSPFFSFPAVLGHEILGEFAGTRVAVNPLLACADRGLDPCLACQRGEEGLCRNVAEGRLAPGMLGYHRELPGGWGERVVVRPERLVEVPPGVPDARAVLAEPLAVVLRGIRRAFWRGQGYAFPPEILVIGAGTIGLLAVRLLRELGFSGRLDVVARRRIQAELAAAFGASRVHSRAEEALAGVGAQRYRPVLGAPVWRGGYGAVIEAAGSSKSLDEAAWGAVEGGTVLLLGAAGEVRHDFSPHWFRELNWLGSYTYTARDFSDAVAMLPALGGLERMVGGVYPLTAWPQAIRAAARRWAVKVVFSPSPEPVPAGDLVPALT